MKNMGKAIILSLIVIAVAAACGNGGPSQGTIIGRSYTAPFYWAGYSIPASKSCSTSLISYRMGGKTYYRTGPKTCTIYPASYVPGHWSPADYQFDLRYCPSTSDSCQEGWRDVDAITFGTHQKGDYVNLGY